MCGAAERTESFGWLVIWFVGCLIGLASACVCFLLLTNGRAPLVLVGGICGRRPCWNFVFLHTRVRA